VAPTDRGEAARVALRSAGEGPDHLTYDGEFEDRDLNANG